MELKDLDAVLGLRPLDKEKDACIWNDTIIETPSGTYIKNKVPILFNCSSAYVVFNNELYYIGEDDSHFFILSKIHDINQLVDLRNTLNELLTYLETKENVEHHLTYKLSSLNNKFYNKLMFRHRDKEPNDNIIVTFPIGNCLRELHLQLIGAEIKLLDKVIDIIKNKGEQNV